MSGPNEEITIEDNPAVSAEAIEAAITAAINKLDFRQIIADSTANTLGQMRHRLRNQEK